MISIGGRRELSPEMVDSMHDFRHEIFVRRLGWSLPLMNGVERDEFDNEAAVYFIVRDTDEQITACARLLPTTGQYLMSECFQELLGGRAAPHDPGVWELSRFATNVRKTGEGRVLSLSQPTMDLLHAVMRYARRCGARQLALVTSIPIERLLLRAGFDVHRFAAPVRMRDGVYVALFIELPAAELPATEPQERFEPHTLDWSEGAGAQVGQVSLLGT
jgi:acyl homoserine lactone synthase